MNELNELFKENNDWLSALPNYQKSLITELLNKNTEEEVVSIWLATSISNNSPFSAVPGENKKKYLDFLKKEVQALLCGNPKYDSERNELIALINKNVPKEVIISFISAAIGASIGLAATFIAPVIVLILMIVGKMSLNAWCALKEETSA